MIYRVVLDGIDILDYGNKELTLLAPVLELEINSSGSLEFVMPPYHRYYDNVHILTSTIEVYEDQELIWFGRPVEQTIDFFKQKKVYCEGPLSFFNDTIQRPYEFEDTSLEDFFNYVINHHNSQQDNLNRKFTVGDFDMPSKLVYRKLNYETTYDVLKSMCLDAEDGYFFFRRESGVNYIDWLSYIPYETNQTIQFGLNMLNYRSSFDGSNYATCVLPLGKNDSSSGEPLTVSSVNNGSDIIISDAAEEYGYVIKVQSWSDISDQEQLMEEGKKYLENTQFNSLIIECSAAELHFINNELTQFRIGQNVRCISNPHLVDREFPLSKISINLDSAAKIITLGIIKRKTLTRIYKQDIEDSMSESGYVDPGYVDPGVFEDENGDLWEIIPPEDDGGEITADRMPIRIEISKEPNKIVYESGETIDYSGISVNIWTKNKNDEEIIWTKPPRYLDGKVPFAELSFSSKTAPNISTFNVQVIWKYKGKSYSDLLQLSTDGLYTDPIIQPIPYSTIGNMRRQDGSGHNTFFEAGSGQLTYYIDGTKRGKWNCIAASSVSGAVIGRTTYRPNGSQSGHYTHKLSKTFTYDGQTVYYSNITTGEWTQAGYEIASVSPACNNGASVMQKVSDNSVAHIAWLMIYG